MKKFLTLLLIVIITSFLSSIYGIIHDQLTYSISPEYYTRFKFYQFGLVEDGITVQNPRLMVLIVGIMATWWMGCFIGAILGLVSFIYKSWLEMLKISLKAICLNLSITIVFGILGYCYAYLFLPREWEDYLITWGVPYETVDIANFVRVGTMHNFSYIGGAIGLIISIIYIIKSKKAITLINP